MFSSVPGLFCPSLPSILDLTETCCEAEEDNDVTSLYYSLIQRTLNNTNYILHESNLPSPTDLTVLVSYQTHSSGPHDEIVGIPDYGDNYFKIAGARDGGRSLCLQMSMR